MPGKSTPKRGGRVRSALGSLDINVSSPRLFASKSSRDSLSKRKSKSTYRNTDTDDEQSPLSTKVKDAIETVTDRGKEESCDLEKNNEAEEEGVTSGEEDILFEETECFDNHLNDDVNESFSEQEDEENSDEYDSEDEEYELESDSDEDVLEYNVADYRKRVQTNQKKKLPPADCANELTSFADEKTSTDESTEKEMEDECDVLAIALDEDDVDEDCVCLEATIVETKDNVPLPNEDCDLSSENEGSKTQESLLETFNYDEVEGCQSQNRQDSNLSTSVSEKSFNTNPYESMLEPTRDHRVESIANRDEGNLSNVEQSSVIMAGEEVISNRYQEVDYEASDEADSYWGSEASLFSPDGKQNSPVVKFAKSLTSSDEKQKHKQDKHASNPSCLLFGMDSDRTKDTVKHQQAVGPQNVEVVLANGPEKHWDSFGTPTEKKKERKASKMVPPKTMNCVRRGKWTLGSKIGKGSFGVVHVGMNMLNGQMIAVKSIDLDPVVLTDVRREIDVLKSLKHLNIVQYLGAERQNKTLHIFQEWVAGGSVSSILKKFGPFSAEVMKSYIHQILEGLSYLHRNQILHRDIKGGNVLVSNDGIVKLADFGASKRIAHQQADMMETMTMRGTPFFMAPEVFEEKYGTKADVWSVGCVAFQMATGVPPWKKEGFTNPMSLFVHLQKTEGTPPLHWPKDGPMRQSQKEPFEILLEDCFWRDPSKRPTTEKLLNHHFFSQHAHSEDDGSTSVDLFSPYTKSGASVSTAGTTSGQVQSPITPFQPVGFSELSTPPLPRIQINNRSIVSPLPILRTPNLDSHDWPEWAKERISQIQTAHVEKIASTVDSLALSDQSEKNPFARDSNGSSLSLNGLAFLSSS